MERTRYKHDIIILLSSIVNVSNHTNAFKSNRKVNARLNLLIHPMECSQEFHCYQFSIDLDRCVGSLNTLNDLSNKVCIPNKTRRFKSKYDLHDYMNK